MLRLHEFQKLNIIIIICSKRSFVPIVILFAATSSEPARIFLLTMTRQLHTDNIIGHIILR